MDKIRCISRFTRRLFWLGIILTPLCVIGYWITDGDLMNQINFQFYSFPLPDVASLPAITKFYGFLITLIPAAFLIGILFFAARLLRHYENGDIFTLSSAKLIRLIAIAVLLWEAVRPVYDILISYALTLPTGHPKITVVFDSSNVRSLIIGILLFVIGWVMVEACKIKEEHDYTV